MDFGLAGASYGGGGQPAQQQPEQAYTAEERAALIKKLNKFDQDLGSWASWRKEAREARNMVKGDQWPQEALDALELEDPTASPAVFNFVDPMVGAICGAEINNRQEVKYTPRQVGDVQANEVLTGAADWCRDECDAGDEESQAFRDAVVVGFGCTETRMDYIDDPQGMVKVDRVDTVNDKVEVDTTARKPNYVDAKYMKRTRRYDECEARALFPQLFDVGFGLGASAEDLSAHVNNPETRYDPDARENKGDAALPDGMVEVAEYQWRELERVTLVVDQAVNPLTGMVEPKVIELRAPELEKLASVGINVQTMLQSASVMRPRWRRCFRSGNSIQCKDLPDGEFTYKFITGKLDDDTGKPYGVVKAMIDPQRWTNKFMLQMDRIFATNAKGGLIMEEDAVEDVQSFEASYAKRDKISWVADGAIGAQKIQPKPQTPFPVIADRLLNIAMNAVQQVTGVNKEMLGMAERDQAGVLEYQRKQAAFGVLAVFFDSVKRYRKLHGRLLLKYINKYMSDGRLIRITGSDGLEKYVPLAKNPETAKFDVIVDEAPAGPNQVERTWATFVQGAPMIKNMLDMGLAPEVIFTILEYSPLPASFVQKLRERYAQAAQTAAQQPPNPQQQLQMAGLQAQVQKTQGEAQLAAARAHAAQIEAMLAPQRGMADAAYTGARAKKANTEADLAPQQLILDARDQQMNWEQAQMSHQANMMRFQAPGFGAGWR